MRSVTAKMIKAARTTLIGAFFRRLNEFSSFKNTFSFSAVDCLFAFLCFILPRARMLVMAIKEQFWSVWETLLRMKKLRWKSCSSIY